MFIDIIVEIWFGGVLFSHIFILQVSIIFSHFYITGDVGVLVHCISGWDRTPLFVSLLRLSLWADGAIHKSLSAVEIVYLTLAYDWYLFG